MCFQIVQSYIAAGRCHRGVAGGSRTQPDGSTGLSSRTLEPQGPSRPRRSRREGHAARFPGHLGSKLRCQHPLVPTPPGSSGTSGRRCLSHGGRAQGFPFQLLLSVERKGARYTGLCNSSLASRNFRESGRLRVWIKVWNIILKEE